MLCANKVSAGVNEFSGKTLMTLTIWNCFVVLNSHTIYLSFTPLINDVDEDLLRQVPDPVGFLKLIITRSSRTVNNILSDVLLLSHLAKYI